MDSALSTEDLAKMIYDSEAFLYYVRANCPEGVAVSICEELVKVQLPRLIEDYSRLKAEEAARLAPKPAQGG